MRLFFSPVERMLAARYVRSRRAEGFISVIAWFSLAGITLGVATLIIVMSVMNGFRAELIGRILGLNGHVAVYAAKSGGIEDFDRLALSLAELPTVIAVTPQIEGQAMVTANAVNLGAVVRGVGGRVELRGVVGVRRVPDARQHDLAPPRAPRPLRVGTR
ncbi:MAG: ABC transporter permease, partial [Candidatus Puniceispirillaceae bacterium]